MSDVIDLNDYRKRRQQKTFTWVIQPMRQGYPIRLLPLERDKRALAISLVLGVSLMT